MKGDNSVVIKGKNCQKMHFLFLGLKSRPPSRSIAALILKIGQKSMKWQHFEGGNLPLKSQIDKGNSNGMHDERIL